MSNPNPEGKKSLKMVSCANCHAKNFIPSDLAPFHTVPCNKCGHPVMITLRLRQFELRGFVATGGMGSVYRAWDMSLHREVAVKLMKPELAHDPIQVEAFMREARACAGLNHTNIIHVYAFDETEGQKYLAMELADRGSLDTLIETQGRVDELKVLDVGIQVSSALESALKHKLLHLDIKPLNILFNADGEAKLIDFGLAQSTDAETDYSGSIFGTAYYIAPERMSDQRADFRSDMYSLAATLYHALTGHVPFEAPSTDDVAWAHTNTPLTPPIDVVPDIMPETSEALVRAMAKSPDDRFQTYFEFRMSLERARTALHFRRNPPDEHDWG